MLTRNFCASTFLRYKRPNSCRGINAKKPSAGAEVCAPIGKTSEFLAHPRASFDSTAKGKLIAIRAVPPANPRSVRVNRSPASQKLGKSTPPGNGQQHDHRASVKLFDSRPGCATRRQCKIRNQLVANSYSNSPPAQATSGRTSTFNRTGRSNLQTSHAVRIANQKIRRDQRYGRGTTRCHAKTWE